VSIGEVDGGRADGADAVRRPSMLARRVMRCTGDGGGDGDGELG
jgi:hypothetical protein